VGLAPAVLTTRDVGRFAAATEEFLLATPVEHNVLATVLGAVREGVYPGALCAWAAEGDEVRAALLRTPPRPLLTSMLTRETAEALMPALLAADPELPGVFGPEPAAGHLARAWREQTGGTVESAMSQVVYALEAVRAPAVPPPGRPRPAARSERDLLVEWMVAFAQEAGVSDSNAAELIDHGLAHERLFVWDDGGPRASAGISPAVAGVVRVSFVYTPPAERRRGCATALTADVSTRALAAGASRCMLNADRANPTSNAIYQKIGYRQVGDAREYTFVA
jgi:predicted GNAT family acetyltransferase